MLRRTLCFAAVGLGFAAAAWAGAVADYNAALPGQLGALSGSLTGPLVGSLAFAAASQEFAPAGAKPTLGFNLGAGFGLGVANLDKAAALAAGAAGPNGVDLSQLDSSLPATLALGLGQLNAHLGLPLGFDLGLRYDSLDAPLGAGSVNLTGYAFELRHNLLEEGLVVPVTLALGAGYSRLQGNVHAQSPDYNASGSYEGQVLAGTTHSVVDLDSDVSTYTLRATLSRGLLLLSPYLGAALDFYSGGGTLTVAQEGNVTVAGQPVAARLAGSASQSAPTYELRGAAGVKFNVLLAYLELGAEYGFVSNIAAGHAQLGIDFR